MQQFPFTVDLEDLMTFGILVALKFRCMEKPEVQAEIE